MNYLYCVFPVGDQSGFANIDKELNSRNINFYYSILYSGGRVYRISQEYEYLLPSDDLGLYLGNADCGYVLHHMDAYEADYMISQFGGSDWTKNYE